MKRATIRSDKRTWEITATAYVDDQTNGFGYYNSPRIVVTAVSPYPYSDEIQTINTEIVFQRGRAEIGHPIAVGWTDTKRSWSTCYGGRVVDAAPSEFPFPFPFGGKPRVAAEHVVRQAIARKIGAEMRRGHHAERVTADGCELISTVYALEALGVTVDRQICGEAWSPYQRIDGAGAARRASASEAA